MSNLNIVNDWLKGDNLRPPSITFAQDEELKDIQAKKDACKVGDTYEDAEGRVWKKLGPTTWAQQPKILSALKESNPNCKCCEKEIEYTDRYNVTAYQKSSLCFDCMIEFDSQRKINGTYRDYEIRRVLETQKGWVDEQLEELHEYLKVADKPIEFINEFGDRETWSGADTEQLKKDIQKDIDEGLEALTEINDAISKLPPVDETEFEKIKQQIFEKRKRMEKHEQANA
jgi:hypothetical protein